MQMTGTGGKMSPKKFQKQSQQTSEARPDTPRGPSTSSKSGSTHQDKEGHAGDKKASSQDHHQNQQGTSNSSSHGEENGKVEIRMKEVEETKEEKEAREMKKQQHQFKATAETKLKGADDEVICVVEEKRSERDEKVDQILH